MSAHKSFTITTGASPPPDADASYGEDLSEPNSKDLLAALDELNKREVQILGTAAEAMRACLKDIKPRCKCYTDTPGPTGHISEHDMPYVERYGDMVTLLNKLVTFVRDEQSLRTYQLQKLSQEGSVWRQRALEAQRRATAEYEVKKANIRETIFEEAVAWRAAHLARCEAEGGLPESRIARD